MSQQPIQPPAALTFLGGLPLDTPVTRLVDPADTAKLPPNVASLTKLDLLQLSGHLPPKKSLADLNITFQDIQIVEDSIRNHGRAVIQTAAGGCFCTGGYFCCCCCTPCCCCSCATAVIQPIRSLA